MTIESGRLVIESAHRDRAFPVVPVVVSVIIQGDPYAGPPPQKLWPLDANGLNSPWNYAPQYNHEVVASVTDSSQYTASLYIYDRGKWNTFSQFYAYLDPRTGREFDPNAEFYNPLAS